MKRRDFLRLASTAPWFAAASRVRAAEGGLSSDWRVFELTYTVDLSQQSGAGRLWLPLPTQAPEFQRVLSLDWQSDAGRHGLNWDARYAAPMFCAAWADGAARREARVVARVATRDRGRAVAHAATLDAQQSAFYLAPSEQIPTDGIVAATAAGVVKPHRHTDAKARAIYEWVVENTFRDPKVRGCGLGDIKFMLESGDLGGKCADINSLFVGLCRASGIPARGLYGVRVAAARDFRAMGKTGDISTAQHCRAEYFSPRFGWVPVDPADVRKVVLEEKLPLHDARVAALREHLFGAWEMNWVGFNYARDFDLNPRASERMDYFMYPYAEFGAVRLDGREPARFDFTLTSRELSKTEWS